MMYQRTLQKLTTEEFITESDDEVVAMWERNHMANHDESTDQAYMNAIQEVHQMSMEDSMEANLVMEDIAIEIQWYKDMDEPMEPAKDAWARYWHHHPRPGQEVPADQGADASSSTIPTAGAAKAKSIGTTAKAKAPKVGAKGSCASPANAMPGGAMPATSDAAASASRPFQQATRASHTTKNFQARCSHQPSQASKQQLPNRLEGQDGVDAGHV